MNIEVKFSEATTPGGIDYRIYIPTGLEGPLPAVLFLHGRGESGEDNLRQVTQGLGPAIANNPLSWPCIAIFPQKSDLDILWPDYAKMLNEILADVESTHAIHPTKRYLTGLSQGGNGTFCLARKLRWEFAAVAPICGWADPMASVAELNGIPIWAFHGEQDDVVPFECTVAIARVLERWNSPVKTTIFPAANHNSWDAAYQETELAEWLLSQS